MRRDRENEIRFAGVVDRERFCADAKPFLTSELGRRIQTKCAIRLNFIHCLNGKNGRNKLNLEYIIKSRINKKEN